LGQIVVDLKAGRPTLLRDVAEVKIGAALKRGEGSHNGRPAVILGIQKQPAANTLELTRRLDATIDEIQKGLPAGMKMDRHVFRQSDFIERALGNLTLALRDGSLLVVLVVVIFLMNWRAALVTLLALPLSAITAVLAMQAFGYTLNSMSLGGLAIAIGELVDDAIIDVENVLRRLRENAALPEAERLAPLEVVYQASVEIRSSVLFGTVIVILVFLPLFALSSVEGRLLQPLGFAYVVSLSASLLVALTVTPALCSLLLPGHTGVAEPWLVRLLKAAYAPVLGWTLRHPRVILCAAALIVVLAAIPLAGFGRAFLPDFNEGSLTLSAVTLPGTSLEESDALGRSLERVLLSVPEVASTARRTGRAELDEHVQGVESAELDVALRPSGRSKAAVLADLRDKATLMPGMNVTFGQPISHRIDHMLSGTRANIALKIFGDDLTLLRALAAQVERQAGSVAGIVDLSTEQQTDIPTLRIRVRPEDAARFALTPGEVADSVRIAWFGREVGRVYEGQLSFPVVLRYPQTALRDLSVVRRTLLDSPSGAKVPVEAVADVFEDRGPNFISRENVQRKIVVQANVAGRDLRSTVEALRAAIDKAVVFPPGYRIEYGGQFESEAEASRRLGVLGAMVLVATFFLLLSAFGNARHAALILLNLPLALVGGVYGVAVGGGVLSVASLIGFITLFGIATRNGIMLVSHIQQTEGGNAVARAASERLIPILMTALTAALALIPIANGLGKPGSEIQAPMALVILYGLLSSTLLNMIVVPAAYVLVEGQREAKS
jgi:CzcA family heavy metal efflux pump